MFLSEPDPIAFSIFGFSIRWYGICIATGMLLGLLTAYVRAPRHEIRQERVVDLTLIALPLGVLGARLYYVIFNWDYYQGDFLAMINIRSGGLAIHGGLLLGILSAVIASLAFGIRPLNLMDLVAPGIALAQSIGRWGNYFNQEAHGGPTDLPWAILADGQMVHPTFLYESLWCFLLFLILLRIDNYSTFHGQTFLLYGMLYSVERFFVESLRTDSLMLGPFRMAQVMSLTVFILFFIAYLLLRYRKKKRSRMFY